MNIILPDDDALIVFLSAHEIIGVIRYGEDVGR